MKLYVFLVFLMFNFASSKLEVPLEFRKSWEELAERYRSECICEVGVSPALAKDYFLKGEYSLDSCLHCYIMCNKMKLNLINPATGEVNEHEYVRQAAGITPAIIQKSLSNAFLQAPLGYRQSWEELTAKYRSECMCEAGVSPSKIDDFFIKADYSTDLCVHCYLKCLNIKLNGMDPGTGEVNEFEYVRKVAGATPLIVAQCNNSTKLVKDFCRKAYNMYACILSNVLVQN
ncbi:hypothetical protein RN001_000118 [Aquatica leii]|uniref:Odorant-binding protein n=1 Tax=Aquatica leii TaxID=1421715 RepID=A0AAN7SJ17_9COLE|nr:hypothetical protein RN001_000118 [Aquatica leii]